MVNLETTAEMIAWSFKILPILYHKRLEKSFRFESYLLSQSVLRVCSAGFSWVWPLWIYN